ncbi:hypothetical protein EVAR_18459_1 [Eumeta japonica]|uniref:Uncharacterized protein n=1 Tax=Eumeta variegata TaxID=151549 RepID=A0A4C1V0A0_EUMVA|nr:hypothetical protein EVAR_18459_1 [Eumeta japonica]
MLNRTLFQAVNSPADFAVRFVSDQGHILNINSGSIVGSGPCSALDFMAVSYRSWSSFSRDQQTLSDEKAKQYMYSSSTLSPPPDSSWRRTNSDSALHQSCGDQQPAAQPLSPHHHHHHGHHHTHQNHRRSGDIHLDVLAALGANATSRPRSSCEMPRIPNNMGYDGSGGWGGGAGGRGVVAGAGGLMCSELQLPSGSLPNLTSVHFPPPHAYSPLPHSHQHPHPHRTSPEHYRHHPSPTSPDAISPGGGAGSVSPATGGLSPASGSPVGATVPSLTPLDHLHASLRNEHSLYDAQNISPLDHNWIASSYQPCSPPSQYSSTSNINIPSPTMVHSPGSPVGSPQTDYNNIHQTLLQPFEQITMDWAQLVQSLVESGWTAHVQVADTVRPTMLTYHNG